jgi:hypothetical protein
VPLGIGQKCVIAPAALKTLGSREREFFIGNLLVRIQFIIEMVRCIGLAPWGFEFPFPSSRTSIFLDQQKRIESVIYSHRNLLRTGARVQGLKDSTWTRLVRLTNDWIGVRR